MKIFYQNRLVDISGFHQAAVEGQKLVISYAMAPSGRLRYPDEFPFKDETAASNALEWVCRYADTERTVEFVETEGKFIACVHPLFDY